MHAIYFTAEDAAGRQRGRDDLDAFLKLNSNEMTASPHRAATTSKKKKGLTHFRARVAAMRDFVDKVAELDAWLGHVGSRGLMTLLLTGTFRAEAEFSVVKTRKASNSAGAKRARRQGVGGASTLRDFLRVTESLHALREVRNSVDADKTARRPPTDLFSALTEELERALTKNGHARIREQLALIGEYSIVVVRRREDGKPSAWHVEHRLQARRAHPLFRVLRPSVRVVRLVEDADGVLRLLCSCPFAAAVGLPCRHICAVNGGATFEDVAVRWLMNSHQGCLDEVVFDDTAATKTYPGAMATDAAMGWSVRRAPVCGMPVCETANCKLQTATCKLQTANCKLQTANCKLQHADCRLQTKFNLKRATCCMPCHLPPAQAAG